MFIRTLCVWQILCIDSALLNWMFHFQTTHTLTTPYRCTAVVSLFSIGQMCQPQDPSNSSGNWNRWASSDQYWRTSSLKLASVFGWESCVIDHLIFRPECNFELTWTLTSCRCVTVSGITCPLACSSPLSHSMWMGWPLTPLSSTITELSPTLHHTSDWSSEHAGVIFSICCIGMMEVGGEILRHVLSESVCVFQLAINTLSLIYYSDEQNRSNTLWRSLSRCVRVCVWQTVAQAFSLLLFC